MVFRFSLLVAVSMILMVSCKPLHKGKKGKYKSKSKQERPIKSSSNAPSSVACKLGGDERTIEKKTDSNGGCTVVYTKVSGSKTIADAKNDTSYCDKIVEKVRVNLKQAGFSCQ